MSMSPQQMQQMLAMYKQQFPQGQPATPQQQQLQGLNQVSAGLGAGPGAGTNKTAGGVNGAAQLITALMKAQKMKQIQNQLNSSQAQGAPQGSVAPMYPSQGTTPSDPAGTLANPGGAF
jgi:hypothetical protein